MAFDFDADGSAEVVHAGSTMLSVLSGVDGTIRFQAPRIHPTGKESATVADVDGDGHAEIVFDPAHARVRSQLRLCARRNRALEARSVSAEVPIRGQSGRAMAEQRKPVCVVLGVGPGNGAAFARRFSKEGFQVALLARSTEFSERLAAELPSAKAYACDASDAKSVERAFSAIRGELGDPEVLIYNAGSGVWGTIEEVDAAAFEAAWRVNALGAFLASQQVIPAMKRAGRGSIVFIGATASRRGMPRTTAFAPAKAAQRSLAEAMARHLWKAGIHVALVIIDGVVDLPRTRELMKDKPDSFFVKPDDVASVVYGLTEQAPSAWSFEVEARPFGESW